MNTRFCVEPQDVKQHMVVHTVSAANSDQSRVFGIKCVSTSQTGYITVSSTGVLFEIGDNTTADTTVDTDGEVLIANYATPKAFMDAVNMSDNWSCRLLDVPPDYTITGSDLVAQSNTDCSSEVTVNLDESALANIGVVYSGITGNGHKDEPHGSDAQTYNEIQYVTADIAWASASGATATIFECDDVAGTKTAIAGPITVASGAAFTMGSLTSDIPIASTKGKRLVVAVIPTEVDESVAYENTDFIIYGQSYVFGPAVRRSKLWQNLCG